MKLFLGIFLTIGLGLLTGAFYSYSSTEKFLTSAHSTEGRVVENRYEVGSSSNSGTYHSYITFETDSGKSITFRSSIGTNPPSFKIGDTVKVSYDPQDPRDAQINTFFQLWFLPLLLGGMGAMFTLLPAIILITSIRTKRLDTWLMQNGERIITKYVDTQVDRSLIVNGRSPYFITSQGINPRTNLMQTFKSERIWFDPADYIKDKSLTVYIDRNNAARYFMDTSFLPKSA